MPLVFFASFYLAKAGNISIQGSDIRLDIFLYNFFNIYFSFIILFLKVLFYRLSSDIDFVQNGYILTKLWPFEV